MRADIGRAPIYVVFAHPNRIFCFDIIAELYIIMWARRPISDADFDEYLESHQRFVKETGTGGKAVLNIAHNFVPNARERALLKKQEKELGLDKVSAVALVSASPLVRGAVSALSWVMPGPRTKAFSPGGEEDGLRWLKTFASFEHGGALAALELMRARMG